MIAVNSTMKVADNGGATLFKCIRISGGFAQRYAGLGDVVGSVSQIRRKYDQSMDKKLREKKVRKTRKIKARKKGQPMLRPYLTLLVATKKPKRRKDGSSIKFDTNSVFTFTEPRKFGPHGKTTGVPIFVGKKVFSPLCREAYRTKKLQEKFKEVAIKAGG